MSEPLFQPEMMSQQHMELKRFETEMQRWREESERWRQENEKWRSEMRRHEAESDKLRAEHYLLLKRSRWYEFSIGMAAVAAGIAIAKLFL